MSKKMIIRIKHRVGKLRISLQPVVPICYWKPFSDRFLHKKAWILGDWIPSTESWQRRVTWGSLLRHLKRVWSSQTLYPFSEGRIIWVASEIMLVNFGTEEKSDYRGRSKLIHFVVVKWKKLERKKTVEYPTSLDDKCYKPHHVASCTHHFADCINDQTL